MWTSTASGSAVIEVVAFDGICNSKVSVERKVLRRGVCKDRINCCLLRNGIALNGEHYTSRVPL